jgi:hypothetical protein
MPLAGFEPAVRAIKRLRNYVLDRTATAIGDFSYISINIMPLLATLS